MITRRRLLSGGAAASLLAAPELPAQLAAGSDNGGAHQQHSLNGTWEFRLEHDSPESGWKPVRVPHTWQVEPEHAGYYGPAWYRRKFAAPLTWRDRAVRIEFEAVFHSAIVSVNGKEAGRHTGKGYTAFTLDIGSLLRLGADNTLTVQVDNSFNDSMLPRGHSSDWAHDGGIYRPVQLLVTPEAFVERIVVDADPGPGRGAATLDISIAVRTIAAGWEGRASYRVIDEETGNAVVTPPPATNVRLRRGELETIQLVSAAIPQPKLWHFDHPHLYRVVVELSNGHTLETTFGIRKIEIRGTSFFLNGERVRLMGVERMAGSNPQFGMAEPGEWIDHDHTDLKGLNCVYTRVHWPQDRVTLDWCDRHGILIQTEVPTWGADTFQGMTGEPSSVILNNGLEQLREMIARDRNHPCIFSWGVCNEIGGQNPPAYAFAKRLYEESKRLDPKRLVSYASHSLFKTPGKDVAGLMDYVMCNEYVESWQPGTVDDLAKVVDEIHRAFPDKPVVISEYGYCACTADRPEGDEKRIAVLRGHDRVFREREFIAGLIFFCYNDYRTHIGDRGRGVLKQRVHGVVDVYGVRKPSYAVLREEASPLASLTASGRAGQLTVTLKTRDSVPSYTLGGYTLRTVIYGAGGIPVEQQEVALPDLAPGRQSDVAVVFAESAPLHAEVDVIRPTGHSAHAVTYTFPRDV